MTVRAKVLADSTNGFGQRLLSFELYYPWFVHPEFMTHRVFSRNAASSRAIPITAFIESIRLDTALPARWGKNGKGMQDFGPMSPEGEALAKKIWLNARDDAISRVGEMLALAESPHKQIANRLLMPFAHITVVCTSTNFANFFALRRHKDADPTIQALAEAMWAAYKDSSPTILKPGEWHLPYIEQHEKDAFALAKDPEQALQNLITVSVARCARTSYRSHRNKATTFAEDKLLYDTKIVGSTPMHASPAEHQATPDSRQTLFDPATKKIKVSWDNPELHGNFTGFIQFRKTLPNEFVPEPILY